MRIRLRHTLAGVALAGVLVGGGAAVADAASSGSTAATPHRPAPRRPPTRRRARRRRTLPPGHGRRHHRVTRPQPLPRAVRRTVPTWATVHRRVRRSGPRACPRYGSRLPPGAVPRAVSGRGDRRGRVARRCRRLVRKAVMALAKAAAACCWNPGIDQQGGIGGIGHVPAFDHDLGHRGEVQSAEVVAGHDAVHAVVVAHRHRRLGQEGAADVLPEHLGGADDGIVDTAGHRFEDREAPTGRPGRRQRGWRRPRGRRRCSRCSPVWVMQGP